jgi:iron(III) transport system ATP-binding protein
MLHEVYAILRQLETTAVFVTHDHEEAFMVADWVGVLNSGRLEQLSSPEAIYHRPATRFVARFVGQANFLPGRVVRTGIKTDIGTFPNPLDLPEGATAEVMIRPHHLELRPDATGNGLVVSRRFRGADALVVVQLLSGLTLYSYQPATLGFQARERVTVGAKPCHSVVFSAGESWPEGVNTDHANRDTPPTSSGRAASPVVPTPTDQQR